MDMRALILTETRRLTLERGVVPSLNAVAAAAGVSKGGLMHHFPTRAALVAGLAQGALDDVDAVMAAAPTGQVAQTWLRLSLPSGEELELLRAMAFAYRASGADGRALMADARAAIARWESMISAEVGDPVRAQVIRLVGDALVANALTGIEPAPGLEQVDALMAHLTAPAASVDQR